MILEIRKIILNDNNNYDNNNNANMFTKQTPASKLFVWCPVYIGPI